MSATVERTVTVTNSVGIHMRPADLLSREAGRFQSDVSLTYNDVCADCKSIMSILTLAALPGAEILVRATGDDAQSAVDAIASLFESGFDESDSQLTNEQSG